METLHEHTPVTLTHTWPQHLYRAATRQANRNRQSLEAWLQTLAAQAIARRVAQEFSQQGQVQLDRQEGIASCSRASAVESGN